MEKKRTINRYSVMLGMWLLCLLLPSVARSQDFDVGVPVQPAPEIRLTGVLQEGKEPTPPTYPLLAVWIAGKQELFRVTRVEPVIPAYPAEEELRKVSGLGLRLLAEHDALAALQNPEMHNRPIIIKGWLRVQDGVLDVESVQKAEGPQPSDP